MGIEKGDEPKSEVTNGEKKEGCTSCFSTESPCSSYDIVCVYVLV